MAKFKQVQRIFVANTVFLMLFVTACSKSDQKTAPATVAQVPTVKTMIVAAFGSAADVRLAAEVRPRFETRLAFRVAGRIIDRKVEVGQLVKAGTLIARIDPADYALAAQAAQSATVAAQADASLANAELKRYQDLADKGFISTAALEQRRATALGANARLKQSQASTNVQTNQASYANLTSPESGTVIAVEADPGQVISAGQTVVRIARGQSTDAVIAMPEQWLAGAKAGKFKVTIPAIGKSVDAQLREVSATADPATRTYAVKLSLPDDTQIKLGMSAQVVMSAPTLAGALPTVPLSAIVERGGKSIVFVVDPQTSAAQAKVVEVVSAAVGTDTQVSGLKTGDRIVVAGGHLLTVGQQVRLAP